MSLRFVDRRGWDCKKYDLIQKNYGEDVLPAWIADMDLATAPAIIEALLKRVEHGAFGYTFRSEEFYEAIISWYRRRYGFEVKREWIVDGVGVMPMMAMLINVLTDPGDKVIIQTPVYPPFFGVVQKNKRVLVENRLVKVNGAFRMDLDSLRKLIDERTKLLILCNPHNPVGRAWTLDELKALYDIALEHNLIIISDEIHGDIVYDPNRFTTMLKAGLKNTIVLHSPGKTFNIPALTISYGIIPDEGLRQRYIESFEALELTTGNVFGILALKTAYLHGEPWLEELLRALKSNRDMAYSFLRENCPLIDPTLPEATFLMWLDCSKLGLKNPQEFFLEKARVYMNNGGDFGDPNCVRLNFSCDKDTLKEILLRIKYAYDTIEK
ncbi:MAG: PatB family C-S lyase [Synergistetes bacterium]|nr:PatB family C-S lyase [Synergistota bacterium]MDW8191676.1 PatB family C-S lyase [Synergistota bacterium]